MPFGYTVMGDARGLLLEIGGTRAILNLRLSPRDLTVSVRNKDFCLICWENGKATYHCYTSWLVAPEFVFEHRPNISNKRIANANFHSQNGALTRLNV